MESMPDELTEFLRMLLSPKDSHHITSETINRHVSSFAQDLVHSISRGTFLTLKHTCVGLGLHSMTGMKIPIVILSRLDNSISYDTVLALETAQAEVSHQFDLNEMGLPIQPKGSSFTVPTVFWFDNFDSFIDNNTGAGSIHNTPGVAFQEENDSTMRRPDRSTERTKRRSLTDTNESLCPKVPKINPKKNPGLVPAGGEITAKPTESWTLLSLWKAARFKCRTDQRYSRFTGFVIQCHNQKQSKTVLTYLPPIERPITDYGTLFEVLKRAERLSAEANMKYVHVIMDCGAAMKMFHVLFNNPEKYSNVIVHLGDFHFMQAFFDVIGRFISCSGFEDIVYQLGLCQPGSMNAMIKGKHYNQAWLIHEMFAEAIVRIFMEKHLPEAPAKLTDINNENVSDAFSDVEIEKYLQQYNEIEKKGLNGDYGLTPQYWLRYVNFVDNQHILHQSIQLNDFEMRLLAWDLMMAPIFFFDKSHYSRYGTLHVHQMKNIETLYPGAKEEMMALGISVRRNEYGIGQAIDLAGEQSFMRNAKTAGGIKSFQTKQTTVLKWVRNRAQQNEFVEGLKEMAGVDKTTRNLRKCLRPSEIVKSNEIVEALIGCMRKQFTNPFDDSFNKDKLYNIVSGRPVSDKIAASLSNVEKIGTNGYNDFKTRLYGGNKKTFFNPIKRNKQLTFKDSVERITISGKNKKESLQIERNILAVLVAESSLNGKAVDLDRALSYPLSVFPPSYCTGDGERRKTTKSSLLPLLGDMTPDDVDDPATCEVYMEDLAAFVRSTVSQCKTIRDLSMFLWRSKPSHCHRFYVMEDSYDNDGIKTSERRMRGQGERYVLKNLEMKIPYDINSFLAVGENKRDLFDLIHKGIEDIQRGDNTVMFSSYNSYVETNGTTVQERPELASTHVEADYMFPTYARLESNALIRSRSGDIDIIASLVGQEDLPEKLFVDNGTGSGRKVIQPSLCELSSDERTALIGFHSFTGNDYVSSFFRKGKKTCWKTAKRKPEFMKFFSELGRSLEIDGNMKRSAEAYVCALYGKMKLQSVNEARSAIFWEKYNKNKTVIELSLLPPCQANLVFHLQRANYVAFLMRSTTLKPNIEHYTKHGWSEDGQAIWSKDYLPDEMEDVLYDDAMREKEKERDREEESSKNWRTTLTSATKTVT